MSKVKEQSKRRPGVTRVSGKNQVTIPVAELRAAGMEPGDTVRVRADGAGRLELTRLDELIERNAGVLDTGGKLRSAAGALRDEWR